jgi:hypothetical protein
MLFRTAFRVLLLPRVCACLCSATVRAQSSPRSALSVPPTVTCDEFMEMTARKVFPKVVIYSVTFDGPTHLPAAILKGLVTSLTHREFDGDPKWLEGIEELPLRETWQDQGYFQAEVSARAALLRGDATCQHFSVTFA